MDGEKLESLLHKKAHWEQMQILQAVNQTLQGNKRGEGQDAKPWSDLECTRRSKANRVFLLCALVNYLSHCPQMMKIQP